MNRTEFSNLLVQTKINSGVSSSELMFALKVMPSQLRRIEKAENNYSLNKAIGYLNILNHYIHVANEYFESDVKDSFEAIEIFRTLKGDVPTPMVAPYIGISNTTVNQILAHKGGLTIDVFMSICEFYKLNIKIRRL